MVQKLNLGKCHWPTRNCRPIIHNLSSNKKKVFQQEYGIVTLVRIYNRKKVSKKLDLKTCFFWSIAFLKFLSPNLIDSVKPGLVRTFFLNFFYSIKSHLSIGNYETQPTDRSTEPPINRPTDGQEGSQGSYTSNNWCCVIILTVNKFTNLKK